MMTERITLSADAPSFDMGEALAGALAERTTYRMPFGAAAACAGGALALVVYLRRRALAPEPRGA